MSSDGNAAGNRLPARDTSYATSPAGQTGSTPMPRVTDRLTPPSAKPPASSSKRPGTPLEPVELLQTVGRWAEAPTLAERVLAAAPPGAEGADHRALAQFVEAATQGASWGWALRKHTEYTNGRWQNCESSSPTEGRGEEWTLKSVSSKMPNPSRKKLKGWKAGSSSLMRWSDWESRPST